VYFFLTIIVVDGLTTGFTTGEALGVYGLGFQVLVGIGFGFGEVLLPFCLAVIINFPVLGSVYTFTQTLVLQLGAAVAGFIDIKSRRAISTLRIGTCAR
jgi:hypothetical protein